MAEYEIEELKIELESVVSSSVEEI
jgi:negative regulator of sigma E activity